MTPASSSEARRRVVLMLLREGRIGPGVADAQSSADDLDLGCVASSVWVKT
jgi:hypothetical protein